MSCVASRNRRMAPESGRTISRQAGRISRVWLLAAIALSGCAIYRPLPLDAGDQHASLAAAAQKIEHPRLTPLKIDPNGPWDDLQLADLAIVVSPQLQALRAQNKVAHAQVFSAGLLPDPQLGIGVDKPDGSGVVSALSLSAGIDLGALFTRHRRVAGARAAAAQVRNEVAWQEWLVANQVRLLARRYEFLQRQHAIAASAADAADKLLALTQTSVDQGNAKLDELVLRRVAVLDARDRERSLQRDAEATRLQLNQTVGVDPQTQIPLRDTTALHDPAALDAATLDARAIDQRLDLAALRAGYASQEAAVRTAILQQYPLPNLTISRARDTTPVYTKGAALSLSLPLWNRNRGAVAVADATREQLHAEYTARVFDAHAVIAAQIESLQEIAAQRKLLDAQLDAMNAEMQPLQAAAQRRDVALVTYETARAALLDKRIASVALAQAQSEGEVALDIAVGSLVWQ